MKPGAAQSPPGFFLKLRVKAVKGMETFKTLFKMTLALSAAAGLTSSLTAKEPEKANDKLKAIEDIQYADIGGRALKLDLFLPKEAEKPPLVVCIHGGGWRTGNHKKMGMQWLAEGGYAAACVEYRFSQEAKFPAQIYDCKGAVRWLRAHAGEYGYDPERFAILGQSAGGHLALLLGTSAGEKELEGDVGGNLSVSSEVQAIVDFYGPSDFILRSKDQPQETERESGKVWQLLGKPVKGNEELAKLASGAWHVGKGDPPLLAIHGTADKTVLPNQTERICAAYGENGLSVEFHSVEGGGHGGPKFETPEVRGWVLAFLDRVFKTKGKAE